MVQGPLSGKPERVLRALDLELLESHVSVLFDSKAYVQHNDWPIERHIIEIFVLKI